MNTWNTWKTAGVTLANCIWGTAGSPDKKIPPISLMILYYNNIIIYTLLNRNKDREQLNPPNNGGENRASLEFVLHKRAGLKEKYVQKKEIPECSSFIGCATNRVMNPELPNQRTFAGVKCGNDKWSVSKKNQKTCHFSAYSCSVHSCHYLTRQILKCQFGQLYLYLTHYCGIFSYSAK